MKIFVNEGGGSINQVEFFIDDIPMNNPPFSIDTTAPFELDGDNMFDIDQLGDGPHSITAKVQDGVGHDDILVANFTVSNSSGGGNFTFTTAYRGLTTPTAIEFAPDGRAFVAEKSGVIKAFDYYDDLTPDVVYDLQNLVFDGGDNGLLGMALDPNFATNGHLYILYSYDYHDLQAQDDPKLTTARLSRIEIDSNNNMVGNELVLIDEQWCNRYQTHTIGTLMFGPDGALYAGGGDGARFSQADIGLFNNGCDQSDPTNEGGALRSLDILTPGDPFTLDGTIIRLDAADISALETTPLVGDATPAWALDKIIAYGLRNSFRWDFRPGTNEIWIGDVGWNTWEEINIIDDYADTNTTENFGWPCYEGDPNGSAIQPSYDATNVPLCEDLYSGTIVTDLTEPFFAYQHEVAGWNCPQSQGGSISALTFYDGTSNYPSAYDGAFFFGDYSRRCIAVMFPDGSQVGIDPLSATPLASDGVFPVQIKTGPDGALYYVDIAFGEVKRLTYLGGNQPPVADFTATPTDGPDPLAVSFDASASSDPNLGTLMFEWDFEGTGNWTAPSASATANYNYSYGTYTARLRVSDPQGATDEAEVIINSGNTPPTAAITAIEVCRAANPTTDCAPYDDLTRRWHVGDTINVTGTATDAEDGDLTASIDWTVLLYHCNVPYDQDPT